MSIADALELILATGLDLNPGNCPVMPSAEHKSMQSLLVRLWGKRGDFKSLAG